MSPGGMQSWKEHPSPSRRGWRPASCSRSYPGQVGVVGLRVPMHEHAAADRRHRARVGPLMGLGVTVCERQNAAAIMQAGRVMEKAFHLVRHVNHERGIADAVGMNILESEQFSGRGQIGCLEENFVAWSYLPRIDRPP